MTRTPDRDAASPAGARPWLAGLAEEPAPGSHLATRRFGYMHHGLYAGNGRVIHYAGLHRGLSAAPVAEVSIEEFALGHEVTLIAHPGGCFEGEEAIRRARSRLGESRYRLLTNNCEHFCNWCLTGDARSAQVERAFEVLGRAFGAGVGRGALAAAKT